MRRFILCLIVLLISAWIGVKIAVDPGYVLIARQHWSAEMPLWVAATALLGVFFLLYGALRLLRNLRLLPSRWRQKIARRREQRAQKRIHYSLLALLAGDWPSAEKKSVQAGQSGNLAWFSYLIAAIAAHAQQAFARRDNYLSKSRAQKPETEVAAGLLRAQLQLQQHQFEQARVTLQHLHQLAPKQAYITYRLAQVYVTLKEWHELPALLPLLRQQKALPQAQITALEITAYRELATQLPWQMLPRHLRANPSIISRYGYALIAKNAPDEAEALIRKTLQKNWSTELITCYGRIKSSKPDQQLTTAESWLPRYEHDAALLLTLGRLCLDNQLWGKARSYLQASLAIAPTPETYLELGKLQEQLGNHEAALDCYRLGLTIFTN